jgi:hypothetical protein
VGHVQLYQRRQALVKDGSAHPLSTSKAETDDAGVMWATQLFFSLTDLIPAYIGYCMLAANISPPQHIMQTSLAISVAHIILAMWDQGAAHIVTGSSLVYRDLGFFISDLAGVALAVPVKEMRERSALKVLGAKVAGLVVVYQVLKVYTGSR